MGWFLALANVALAIAQFAEPVLFGRVINVLAGAKANDPSAWTSLSLLLIAWVGFGIFTIICGTLVALYADRMAHRRRLAVLTEYFEHVLQLPLAYHGEVHSGRLMKIMLEGTDALWALWLGFFREHLAAFVSLLILVPLSLFINWRLAILLIALVRVIRRSHDADLAQDRIDAAQGADAAFGPCRARLRRARQYRPGAKFRAGRAGGDARSSTRANRCWRRNFPC